MQLIKDKQIKKGANQEMIEQAKENKVINQKEYTFLTQTESMKDQIIQVDSFTQSEYLNQK